MATREAMDHQTHVVTSVMKSYHSVMKNYHSESPEEEKEK